MRKPSEVSLNLQWHNARCENYAVPSEFISRPFGGTDTAGIEPAKEEPDRIS